MSKKLKVLISALVVALLLTVGATATVMADGEGEETTPPAEEAGENGLLERVAEILGIDEEDLLNAFKQARQEMREDAFISRLDKAVEEGLITQEQADEILAWWLQRPDDALEAWQGDRRGATGPGMFKHALRFRAMPKFQMQNRLHRQNGIGGWFCPEPPAQTD